MTSNDKAGPSAAADAGAAATETLDAVLERLGAKLNASELQALYMGALTSTNLSLDPLDLFDAIFGDEFEFDGSLDDVNANFEIVFGFWNELNELRRSGAFHLSNVALSDAPSIEELRMLAERRSREIISFFRGLAAGDPNEFGEDGQELVRTVEEGADLALRFLDILGRERATPTDLVETRKSLEGLTAMVEDAMRRLSGLSDAVRARAVADAAVNSSRDV